MDSSQSTPSPVLAPDHQWTFEKRKGVYESEVTALVRRMLEDEAIQKDQRTAWERWRNDPTGLK